MVKCDLRRCGNVPQICSEIVGLIQSRAQATHIDRLIQPALMRRHWIRQISAAQIGLDQSALIDIVGIANAVDALASNAISLRAHARTLARSTRRCDRTATTNPHSQTHTHTYTTLAANFLPFPRAPRATQCLHRPINAYCAVHTRIHGRTGRRPILADAFTMN